MMTRKDYIRAAEIVRETGRRIGMNAADYQRAAFLEFFKGDNPAFDRERFNEACEPPAPPKNVKVRNRKIGAL